MDDGSPATAVVPDRADLRWTTAPSPVVWAYRHQGVTGPVAEFAVASDLRELADGELLDVAASLDASVAMLQARASEAVAELARRRELACADDEPEAPGPRPEFVADEVAARLHLTRYAADRRVSEAVALAERLPATLAAWRRGDLDAPRVRIIVAGTEQLDDEGVATVDSAVAAVAPALTTGELRGEVEREVLAVDAAAVRRRAEAAEKGRRVQVRPIGDGMGEVIATGPVSACAAIMGALNDAARERSEADDGIDARRFDSLEKLVTTGGAGHGPGCAKPHVNIVIALSTLLGLDENPAELTGIGPLPAHLARQAARDGVLRRLLTAPVTGELVAVDGHTHAGLTIDPPEPDPPDPDPPDDDGPGPPGGDDPSDRPDPPSGRSGRAPPTPARGRAVDGCPVNAAGGGLYRPRLALDRLVRLRDARCSHPGCRLPSQLCDVDHVIPHPFGPTCACNLVPLCRRHHRMKHQGGWTLRRLADGTLIWTAPTGHLYRRDPAPLLRRPLAPCPPVPSPDGPVRRRLRHVEADGGLARLQQPEAPTPHTRPPRVTSPTLALPAHLVELLARPSPPTDGPPPF